jgi:S-adenosylmethionine decarboxylase
VKNPFAARASLAPLKNVHSPNPIPGLHIVANFAVSDASKLFQSQPFRDFIKDQIRQNSLKDVGSVFHDFEGGGFTAVVCLTESHLSIHTWPENSYITFDIFLSNYLKDNRELTRRLYLKVKEYFNATVLFEQIIDR